MREVRDGIVDDLGAAELLEKCAQTLSRSPLGLPVLRQEQTAAILGPIGDDGLTLTLHELSEHSMRGLNERGPATCGGRPTTPVASNPSPLFSPIPDTRPSGGATASWKRCVRPTLTALP